MQKLIEKIYLSLTVNAQGKGVQLENPLKNGGSFEEILKAIGDFIILIGAPIAVLMILIGAFQIMTSGGEPEKLTRGKKTILWTAIGYGILAIGWGIAEVISGVLKVKP